MEIWHPLSQSLTFAYMQGEHDFHLLPSLCDTLLLIELLDWVKDALTSPMQPTSMDCIWYVQKKMNCTITRFPFSNCFDSGQIFCATRWAPVGFVQVAENRAQVNDVVVYHNQSPTGSNHIGVLVARYPDIVESKFTHGHVFRHPIALVPAAYGPFTTFYQRALQCDEGSANPFPNLNNMERWVNDYGSIFAIKISHADEVILRSYLSHQYENISYLGPLHGNWQNLYMTSFGFLDDVRNRDIFRALLSPHAVPGQDLQPPNSDSAYSRSKHKTKFLFSAPCDCKKMLYSWPVNMYSCS